MIISTCIAASAIICTMYNSLCIIPISPELLGLSLLYRYAIIITTTVTTVIIIITNTKILISGLIAISILVFTYYILNKNSKLNNKLKETFSSDMLYQKVKHNFTNPCTINPNMNVLLPEIQDNPNRLPAAPSYKKAVENTINEETKDFIVSNFDNNENIKKKLFDDKGKPLY